MLDPDILKGDNLMDEETGERITTEHLISCRGEYAAFILAVCDYEDGRFTMTMEQYFSLGAQVRQAIGIIRRERREIRPKQKLKIPL